LLGFLVFNISHADLVNFPILFKLIVIYLSIIYT
jgi:hypothetical protein